jgi:hypothetical protein
VGGPGVNTSLTNGIAAQSLMLFGLLAHGIRHRRAALPKRLFVATGIGTPECQPQAESKTPA